MKITTEKDLDAVALAGRSSLFPARMKIMVGSASCGKSAGAAAVEEAALSAVKELKLDAVVTRTGCVGFCQREPLVDIMVAGSPRVCYGEMTAAKIRKVLESYAADGNLPAAGALFAILPRRTCPRVRLPPIPRRSTGSVRYPSRRRSTFSAARSE
jgi:(2Fe-2S) ferredoxin